MGGKRQLRCTYRGVRCVVLKLGLEGNRVRISCKGKAGTVPFEAIKFIKGGKK